MAEVRPLPVVHRQTLHMVAVNAEEIATAIGLPPISSEVEDAEKRDAEKRLQRIAKLRPAIHDQAAFLSAVFTRVQRDGAAAQGMPVHDIDWEPVQQTVYHHLNTNGMALVALLVDLGVVHLDAEWESPSEQAQEQP